MMFLFPAVERVVDSEHFPRFCAFLGPFGYWVSGLIELGIPKLAVGGLDIPLPAKPRPAWKRFSALENIIVLPQQADVKAQLGDTKEDFGGE
jgi:hypothetical protein